MTHTITEKLIDHRRSISCKNYSLYYKFLQALQISKAPIAPKVFVRFFIHKIYLFLFFLIFYLWQFIYASMKVNTLTLVYHVVIYFVISLRCSDVCRRFAARPSGRVCSRDWYPLLNWMITSLTVGMPVFLLI